MTKKFLFWFPADFTHYCIAYNLQKKLPNSKFFGIVDVSSKPESFFKHQKLVNFEKLWFYHDHIKRNKEPDINYLKQFEKNHNLNLWKLAINERIFYHFLNFHKFSDDEILSIEEQTCKFFESVLDEIKPDFLLIKEPGYHHLQLLYEICRSKGIQILILTVPKIGSKCIISQDSTRFDNPILFDQIKIENKTFDELMIYLSTRKASLKMDTATINPAKSKSILIKAVLKYIFSKHENSSHYNYYGRTKPKVLLFTMFSLIKKQFRYFFMNQNLKKELDFSSKFILFALAVDMDRNSLIGAPFFTNQIEIIRSIAKSLPVNYKLVVKEHPGMTMRDWRKISELKEILEIPNVFFVHPQASINDLMKKCSAVITVGGSSGLEAAFYGKPVLVFSDTIYSVLPSVFRIFSPEELPDKIKECLKIQVEPKYLEKLLIYFEQNSVDFDWLGFSALISKTFFYDGQLLDSEINQNKMKNFLDDTHHLFDEIVNYYVKKLEI